jgi:hypothetical protein
MALSPEEARQTGASNEGVQRREILRKTAWERGPAANRDLSNHAPATARFGERTVE